jgi:hypothetical protein
MMNPSSLKIQIAKQKALASALLQTARAELQANNEVRYVFPDADSCYAYAEKMAKVTSLEKRLAKAESKPVALVQAEAMADEQYAMNCLCD